ncbi:peptidoglycan DD-metalloendopeptidase family protein [Lentibacter algarum]|uniref:M23 family metallopeptidase n=1 Tax=Lentibacter algarum TaxID=576131 RepID=UPI001C08594C|nr:M23 family metallopeptidase [Lentibacter algarum]MBU2982553.1 peptidoglycan DD-metalloendopeptidase family protein [Lentibacter algarum]
MRTKIAIRLDAFLERFFPERRVFLRSDKDTRFVRLRPGMQLFAFMGAAAVVAWTIIATAVLLMDSIGAGNFREQAKRDQQTYQARLNFISQQRDIRAEEALAAQERFNKALEQISVMQSQLLTSETRRREMETGIEIVQKTLRTAMNERDTARDEAIQLTAAMKQGGTGSSFTSSSGSTGNAALDLITAALAETAAERDKVIADAQDSLLQAAELEQRIAFMNEQNDEIFRHLEEAMTVSVKPLDKMFRAAGMSPDSILRKVRSGYSGQGGPLTPLSFSTRGEEPSLSTQRANRILGELDRLNIYRIAASRAPFANPVKAGYRFTSPFGYRRDPKTGGRRLHKGVDFAGPVGTPLYATADGVVTHAGWSSGYGRLVKIQHEFGIETRYAHQNRIRVKVGQRVSRGDRIGDMGASGRVTGPHVHYEVRVGGKAVNPMVYIKAANNVF